MIEGYVHREMSSMSVNEQGHSDTVLLSFVSTFCCHQRDYRSRVVMIPTEEELTQ